MLINFFIHDSCYRAMHTEECGPNVVGLCAKMKPINGEKLLTYLRHVNFTGKFKYKYNESYSDCFGDDFNITKGKKVTLLIFY